jgi:hypothetical protein
VILCDTGPLVALIDDRQDEAHQRCQAVLGGLRDTLLTTWPCITESMYLVNRVGGWPLQQMLWQLLFTEAFELYVPDTDSSPRMQDAMERYRNVPMDLADASLYEAGERLGIRRIFTLDNDFRIYRFDDGGAFDVIP